MEDRNKNSPVFVGLNPIRTAFVCSLVDSPCILVVPPKELSEDEKREAIFVKHKLQRSIIRDKDLFDRLGITTYKQLKLEYELIKAKKSSFPSEIRKAIELFWIKLFGENQI